MGAPIIGILCSLESFEVSGCGSLRHHAIFSRYVDGLLGSVEASPIAIPAVGRKSRAHAESLAADYVRIVDGLFFPGAASNVARHWYGGGPAEEDPTKHDPDRDATAIPLLRAALDAGVPILGTCRGMQELNVACGGTLTPAVHQTPGCRDHRSRKDLPFAERYGPAHPLHLKPGGWIEHEMAACGHPTSGLRVNSLHAQAVDRLGRGVVAEAWADDRTVEAIRVERGSGFAVGVQWHIEWHTETTPLHSTILRAFGCACAARAHRRASTPRRPVAAASSAPISEL